MQKLIVIFLVFSITHNIARAHLCDNVFAQARDNLIVRVDIRDGQLRVGQEGSFRVYVLNTMDRDIAEIALEVESEQFDAIITPSPDWRSYPALHTTRSNPSWRAPNRQEGRKEFFLVTLRRKSGVPDGAYRINLNLVSKRKNLSFRTLDLEAASDISPIPEVKGLSIDGHATREKWGGALLCADFRSYRRVGRYMERVPSDDQTRIRLAHDSDYLYLLASFHGAENADKDTISIYIAPTPDDKPVILTIDRATGRMEGPDGKTGDSIAGTGAQQGLVEARVPLNDLGIGNTKSFLMNFSREMISDRTRETTYWRGHDLLVTQPISYGRFIFAN